MRNMKKDMGGSAIAISLFLLANYFLKKTKIVLIAPIAENAISSKSMRPGDVYSSVSGKSVEIAHTDAEGRLLLADAIEKASSYNPCMIIDFATLTGAARVALGEDLPAYFCNNETFAKKIENLNKEKLRCWRLPLYSPYLSKIKSQVADLSNASLDGMAGSITAALFLQEFLKSPKIPWFHFDTFAWSQDSKGAALQGLDIMSDFLRKNFN
jgi:leucyl aminopeptidase